jgi:PAS domain S-box-containing protein
MTRHTPPQADALDRISEGALITDLDQLIVYANAAFTTITGYEEAEILGANCRFLQDAQSDPRMVEAMRNALMADKPFQGEILNRRKDGTHFWNSLTVSPMRDSEGVTTHFLSVQRELAGPTTAGGAPGDPAALARMAGDSSRRAYREAAAEGRQSMFMHPIVDLRTGAVVMVESLARLHSPDGDVIPTTDFISSLSGDDLDRLFQFGIESACAAMTAWDAEGIRLDVSVNLDPSTLLNPLCIVWVEEVLARHSIPAGRLVLELLETGAATSEYHGLAIGALRRLGVRLAIDDLGSGFSNLRRLSTTEFDLIKIDAGILGAYFQRPLETLRLFAALTQLSRSLGRDAVVEGIENAEIAAVASILGANFGQGFYFARPMPAEDIPGWMRLHTAAASSPVALVAGFPAALAFHFQHQHGSFHPGSHADCPLTPFMAAYADAHGINNWHRAVHGVAPGDSPAAVEASDLLLEWLVDGTTSHAATPEPLAGR